MRGTGADQPVVASKPGNAGGAKGLNGSADGMDQPAMGGIHAGSEVVRRGPGGGRRSTSVGGNRCLKGSLTLFQKGGFGGGLGGPRGPREGRGGRGGGSGVRGGP